MKSTLIRVPLMIGLPKRTLRFTWMRFLHLAGMSLNTSVLLFKDYGNNEICVDRNF